MRKTKRNPLAKNQRNKRLKKRRADTKLQHVIPKPGVRPISLFSPDHPVRRFGRDDERAQNLEPKKWMS